MNPTAICQSILSFSAIQVAALRHDNSMMKGKFMDSYTSAQFLNLFYK